MFNENPELIITSLDKQIWDEELEDFVPKNIFDIPLNKIAIFRIFC